MKILVTSVSRSDFGILSNLIGKLFKDKFFNIELLITGEHNSKLLGYTKREVFKSFNKKVRLLKISDNKNISSKTILIKSSEILYKISEYYKKINPDLVLLLGDRYETLLLAYAALICDKPIAHIHGGEKTIGSKDDIFRHCISKISNIHFVERVEYKKRLVQLGENKNKIYIVDSLGRENIKKIKFQKKNMLEKKYKFNFFEKNLIFTFHPENKKNNIIKNDIRMTLEAIRQSKNIRFIFTSTNLDNGSDVIRDEIFKFIKKNTHCIYVPSFGTIDYFSILKYSDGVIGNSSSGIIEVPALNKFTINIGDRQAGRYKDISIIDCKCKTKEILKSINNAYSKKFQLKIKNNFYKLNNSSNKIIRIIKRLDLRKIKHKEFVDI